MTKNRESYRQILKSTSLFGGVQVVNIVIGVVRSKFIAVLLGPAGMGIASLLNSTIALVQSVTNLGLGTSAVRDISRAFESNDHTRIAQVVTVFKRLVWLTGLLGVVLTWVFSGQLSQFTFGNEGYRWAFQWLSITLLLSQLTSGNMVLLQGSRRIRLLAKANVIGSFVGLLTSVPLYYFFGVEGIVPAIFIMALSTYVISVVYGRSVRTDQVKVSRRETLFEGRTMLKMGIALSISGFAASAVAFYVRAYISNNGSLSDVGLYNAGFAIINTYFGMIFTAMSTDYYPRLSGVVNNDDRFITLVNQQAIVAILIITPILLGFIFFGKWILILLYSKKFIDVTGMIQWAALGIYFKAIGWAMGFILLAKGNSKLYLVSELVANLYLLLFTLIGYEKMGLNGVGIAYVLGYALFMLQIYWISRVKYSYSFIFNFNKIFIIQLAMLSVGFLLIQLSNSLLVYVGGTLLLLMSLAYSLIELDRRMDIRAYFQR